MDYIRKTYGVPAKVGMKVIADGKPGKIMEEEPYIHKIITTEKKLYNPKYGDDRIYKCGHSYYRHFDTYEDMGNVGCKYCDCYEFIEKDI